MNVNLGAPYEAIVQKVIAKGYAGTQVEVLRQALLAYWKELEEVHLVNTGIEAEMRLIRSGKVKTLPLKNVLKKYSR